MHGQTVVAASPSPLVAAAAVVMIAAASALATVGELFFDPSKPRKESRTVDGVEFTFTVPRTAAPRVVLGQPSYGWENHQRPQEIRGERVYQQELRRYRPGTPSDRDLLDDVSGWW